MKNKSELREEIMAITSIINNQGNAENIIRDCNELSDENLINHREAFKMYAGYIANSIKSAEKYLREYRKTLLIEMTRIIE